MNYLLMWRPWYKLLAHFPWQQIVCRPAFLTHTSSTTAETQPDSFVTNRRACGARGNAAQEGLRGRNAVDHSASTQVFMDLELVLPPVAFLCTTSHERPEGMRSSSLFLLPLLLLAGLAACNPAPSDNAPTLASRASLAPPASENKTGPVPANGTIPVGDSPETAPDSATKQANPIDTLEVPAWFTKDLASPYVETRLRALDIWVRSAPVGSIDPLILAYGTDDDERVQARAMELIEQDWARAAEAGQ